MIIASAASTAPKLKPRSTSAAALDTCVTGGSDPFAAQQAQLKALRTQVQAPSLDSKLKNLFADAQSSPNPVLKSTEPVIRNAKHIKINSPSCSRRPAA